MAITQLGLLFIGLLAVLSTVGLFIDFRDRNGQPDRGTPVLLAFLGSILWGTFALSSSDVYVDEAASTAEALDPLFWVGVLLSALVALYAVWLLFQAIFAETSEANIDALVE